MEAHVYEFPTQEESNNEAVELENTWDESVVSFSNVAYNEATDTNEENESSNEFMKGLIIGSTVTGVTVGATLGGLYWKERRINNAIFESIEKTNLIAQNLYENRTMVTYKKEEIDLTKERIENPTDIIISLKDKIQNKKIRLLGFIPIPGAKKRKDEWTEALDNLITQASQYREKENIAKMKEELDSTETLDEKN